MDLYHLYSNLTRVKYMYAYVILQLLTFSTPNDHDVVYNICLLYILSTFLFTFLIKKLIFMVKNNLIYLLKT